MLQYGTSKRGCGEGKKKGEGRKERQARGNAKVQKGTEPRKRVQEVLESKESVLF